MNRFALLTAATMAVSGFGLTGCDQDSERADMDSGTQDARTAGDKVEGGMDRAGDAVDRGMDRAGDATGRAVDRTAEAADQAGDRAQRAADRGGDRMDNATDRAADRMDRAGGTEAAPDAEGIRDVLANIPEAAFTKSGFDDMVERFVDADRNRIGKDNFAERMENDAELNGIVAALQEQWKAKYGKDFDMEENVVFGAEFATIRQSEIGDAARTAGGRVDVDANADRTNGGARAEVNVQNNTNVDNPGTTAADANRNDPGRNTAQIMFKESHGMPGLSIKMIHEMPDFWRVDVPDSVDGPKLVDNLKKHLTAFKDNHANWPADVNDGYRMASHHVYMAIQDKPVVKK
jgi:hypothetical protein